MAIIFGTNYRLKIQNKNYINNEQIIPLHVYIEFEHVLNSLMLGNGYLKVLSGGKKTEIL